MKHTGIYCFTNNINGKQYVGQSIDIENRIKQHQYKCKNQNDAGYGSAFHSALRKYGWDNFSIQILEECDFSDIDEREKYWIETLNTLVPNGYNILVGGQRNRISGNRICPICGKVKEQSSKMCAECWIKQKDKNSLLKKEDINIDFIDDILSSSFEQVAKKLGYKSGNSIKKKLLNAGLPNKREDLLKYFFQIKGYEHPSEQQKKEKERIKEINRKKHQSKKVGQYDLENNLIAVFPSTQEAYRQTGVSSGHISECCREKRKRASGFIWKYIKE